MCSFDINSLFANVPLDETISICANQLYPSDAKAPSLSEKSFIKLIEKVTREVEFTFDKVIYNQINSVAMVSPMALYWQTYS